MKVSLKDSTNLQKKTREIKSRRNLSSTKITFRNSILNLKAQQPSLIKVWSSQQISTLYSAKLYLMWLKKVINLLGENVLNGAMHEKEEPKWSDAIPTCNRGFFSENVIPRKKVRFSTAGESPLQSTPSGTSCYSEDFITPVEVHEKNECRDKFGISGHTDSPRTFNIRGNLVSLTEILKDDPLWSSGSLSAFPLGQSPNDKSALSSAKFSPLEHDSGIFSPNEYKDIIKTHRKSFPEEDKSLNNKFQSPLFASSQSPSLKNGKTVRGQKNSVNELLSPWKQASDSLPDVPTLFLHF